MACPVSQQEWMRYEGTGAVSRTTGRKCAAGTHRGMPSVTAESVLPELARGVPRVTARTAVTGGTDVTGAHWGILSDTGCATKAQGRAPGRQEVVVGLAGAVGAQRGLAQKASGQVGLRGEQLAEGGADEHVGQAARGHAQARLAQLLAAVLRRRLQSSSSGAQEEGATLGAGPRHSANEFACIGGRILA